MARAEKNIILIVGDDDFVAGELAKGAIARHVPEECRTSAVETVPGEAGNAETQLASIRSCLDSVRMPPFLDPVKVTWWKGVTFFPAEKGAKISKAVMSALEHFAAVLTETPLPENQLLVITATQAKQLDPKSIFTQTLKPIADMHECFVPDRSYKRTAAALARLPALAKAENLTFEPGAEMAFVAKAGPDTRTICSELAKMRTYLGEDVHTVTEEDIAVITSAGGDDIEIWSLTDALATRNPARILEMLKNFQGDSSWPITVTTSVEKWFRSLISAKASGATGKTFAERKIAAAASAFTLNELRIARYRVMALRERIVSSQLPDEYVELELLRTVAKRARR